MNSLRTANEWLDGPRSLLVRYMDEAARTIEQRRAAFGERLREQRHAKRWKQKQLAAAVNVEPITVSRWERGEHMPDLDMLDLIAAALGVTAGTLLDGSASQPPAADPGLQALREEVADVRGRLDEVLALLREAKLPGAARRRSA